MCDCQHRGRNVTVMLKTAGSCAWLSGCRDRPQAAIVIAIEPTDLPTEPLIGTALEPTKSPTDLPTEAAIGTAIEPTDLPTEAAIGTAIEPT